MINGRFSLIAAVALVFRDGDKVLLLRRFNTGYMDGHYSLPSGHIDGNETAKQGAIREAREEVGADIKPHDLELLHTMHRKASDHERIDLFFVAKRWAGKLENMEPDRCDELKWVKIKSLPIKMAPEVRAGLQKIEAGEIYSDFNFPQ
ncbi:MAG TPA: NUDIX domain-containing protein [Candidatus Saccharimonadales bacterium]|nr:NUDIX domain-containing protein [Candidatus Saccharimonadales bacterium]